MNAYGRYLDKTCCVCSKPMQVDCCGTPFCLTHYKFKVKCDDIVRANMGGIYHERDDRAHN